MTNELTLFNKSLKLDMTVGGFKILFLFILTYKATNDKVNKNLKNFSYFMLNIII